MFWIVFGTASFTTLIVSWAMMLWWAKSSVKAREAIRKNGFCPECGAPLLFKPKRKKKEKIGFRTR